MKSIVTIGESVVNLVCSGEGASLKNARSFEKVPGGAPAKRCGSGEQARRLGADDSAASGGILSGIFLLKTLRNSGVIRSL